MSALLIVLGLILGHTVVSLASVTTLEWIVVGLTVADDARQGVKLAVELKALSENPAFRAWVAANGDAAIRLQPGVQTFNYISN